MKTEPKTKAESPVVASDRAAPAAEAARYRAILAEVQADLDAFPAHLKAEAGRFFDLLAQSEFSRVVALLPAWLTDLLPVSAAVSHKLGVAHLYGWWYYAAQDELLDGAAPPTVMLAAHLALLKMVAGYRQLGVDDAICWRSFERLARRSAECYTIEVQSRFSSPAELTSDHLASWTVDFIIDRASPFYFNTMAQLHLAGIPNGSPLSEILPQALSYFGAARQISDDAGDWRDDLRKGHLNYVSARLMRRIMDRGLSSGGLDADRLAGYSLTDEAFWAGIEETAQALTQQALDLLSPIGPCRLQALLEHQLARHAAGWAEARTKRAKMRQLFGLGEEQVIW